MILPRRVVTGSVYWSALAIVVAGGCASIPPPAAPPPIPAEHVTQAAPAIERIPTPDAYRRALAHGTRSATGEPGSEYWQNRVVYRIDAELDPEEAVLRGSQRVTYHNRSPDTLVDLVLNLYQNVFSEGVPRNRYVPITGGVIIHRVAIEGTALERLTPNQIPVTGTVPLAPAGYAVQGTLARVRLPRDLPPGDSVTLELDWEHRIPPAPNFRTGWEESLGSRVFHVAQWYPQIAVYDDLDGWDATPYLGDGEFYLEFGDFDVAITLPEGYLIAATGELTNAAEVLTEEARSRLNAVQHADSVTHIVTAADLTAGNVTQTPLGGRLTWRFSASHVRDFAFSASAGYVWDAVRGRSRAPGEQPVSLHAFYRPDAPGWDEAIAFARHSFALFEGVLSPYAYSQLSVAEGPVGGMEYPMVLFIGRPASAIGLYSVIAHEAAHQWFPMMVGSDEAAFAWIDEGLATFLESIAAGDFFDIDDPFAADRQSYLAVAGSDAEVPLMRHTDLVSPYGARVVAAYTKPAVLLRSLNWLLGDELFFSALNTMIEEWRFRRLTPWDVFGTFQRSAGADLAWFFKPWWFETATLDFAVGEVERLATGGVRVTVEDRGGTRVPVPIQGRTVTGDTISVLLPLSAWSPESTTTAVVLEASEQIVEVVIDPDQVMPDAVPANNVWRP